MNNEEITAFVQSNTPEAEIAEGKNFLEIKVPAEKSRSILELLRSDESCQFDYLFCLSGVDQAEHMEVVYHLKSTIHGHEIAVKAIINDRESPTIDTICDIWRTAEFHEREAYDFYGIVFNNHPDLRRIFLEDDWKGWPMRKDYEDPINMISY